VFSARVVLEVFLREDEHELACGDGERESEEREREGEREEQPLGARHGSCRLQSPPLFGTEMRNADAEGILAIIIFNFSLPRFL